MTSYVKVNDVAMMLWDLQDQIDQSPADARERAVVKGMFIHNEAVRAAFAKIDTISDIPASLPESVTIGDVIYYRDNAAFAG